MLLAREGRLARLTGLLDPAGQDVVELEGGKVGFDPKAAFVISAADLADQFDRDRTAYRRAEIEPEPGAARIVQRRRQFDVGVALGRLAVIERSLLPVDLDVAPDLIAGIIGDDL